MLSSSHYGKRRLACFRLYVFGVKIYGNNFFGAEGGKLNSCALKHTLAGVHKVGL